MMKRQIPDRNRVAMTHVKLDEIEVSNCLRDEFIRRLGKAHFAQSVFDCDLPGARGRKINPIRRFSKKLEVRLIELIVAAECPEQDIGID